MQISTGLFVLIVLLALLVGLAVGFLVSTVRGVRRLADAGRLQAEADGRALAAQERAELLERQLDQVQVRAQDEGQVRQLLQPVRARLDDMHANVTRLEREQGNQMAQLQEQLRHARLADEALTAATTRIDAALRNDKVRGQWGEAQLERILEMSGMTRHIDFETQHAIGDAESSNRPDVVIHVPGGHSIAIDAKVPMGSYLAAVEAGAEPGEEGARSREAKLVAHAKAVRGHVDALAKRNYPAKLPSSPPITVMFLPSEALLIAALEADPGLTEHALSKGVAMVGPSGLLSLLQSMASVLRLQRATDEARQLLALGDELVDRVGSVAGHLGELGKSLTKSVEHYNRSVGSMESRLLVTLRRLNERAENLEVSDIDSAHGQVREFISPELAAASHRETPTISGSSSTSPTGHPDR